MSKAELFCSAHTDEIQIDTRNSIVLHTLKESHKQLFKKVHYIPFYFATQDLWNMHTDFPPYPGGHADCVHYCYHPVLWQPIWKLLCDIVVHKQSFVVGSH